LTEGRYEEEGWRQRKDGSRFWANVVLTPIRDQQGSLLGFAKVTRDMTERRRARDELAAARDRTRKLALSNMEKDEFLGFVAHELKNPVTIIEGMARLLHTREHELDEAGRQEAIEALAQESTRMRELVENLLALATPTNTVVKVRCDLREALLATVANIERIYPERAIHMTLADGTVAIEPSLFDRIVSNLLDNACKYSPPGMPVALEVKLTETDVVIDVLDRGPGVDATELGLIFESFYRSPRHAGTAKGKGLGLAVCKRLAEQLGGSIDAALRDGGGMRMRFVLPRESAEAE
jgi:signal transduction histidine kinase